MRIAVTGASGFIGGRTAEYLLDSGHSITALVRTYGNAARLAVRPVEIVQADVLDEPSLVEAFRGAEVVVHCAYGNTQDNGLNERITLRGTENVVRAAVAAGVRRLVHLSTVSVYGSPLPDRVDETTPYRDCDDWYGRSKQLAEKAVLSAAVGGQLEVVALQPAIVYGPWARGWTVEPVQRAADGSLFLYNDGSGTCNTLYVDNLMEAIHLACTRDGVEGHRFLVTDGQPVTWRKFYGHYARMQGVELPVVSSALVAELESRRARWTPAVAALAAAGKMIVRGLRAAGIGTLADGGKRAFKRQTKWMGQTSLCELEFYSMLTVFDVNLAREKLGYQPRYDLTEGMARTEAWLRFTRLIR